MSAFCDLYYIFVYADVIAGVNQFCQDIVDMICLCPPWCTKLLWYFKACWVVFTPFLLTVSVLLGCFVRFSVYDEQLEM